MSYPYFFITPENISEDKIILEGEPNNHLTKVLRVKLDTRVEFSDNIGSRYIATVFKINKKNTELRIIEKKDIFPENTQITLFQCMLKRSSMELVIQKAAEMGIYDLYPVKSKRVVVEDKDDDTKIKRWNKIAQESSKQCKRDFILKINEKVSLGEVVPDEFDLVYLPYEDIDPKTLKTANIIDDLIKLYKDKKTCFKNVKIGLIIGPEGGFEEREVNFLSSLGVKPVSLGKNILKAETASIFISSVIKYTASVFGR
jgi:16S rRNA (uracil1498-N3)-methyltransferase